MERVVSLAKRRGFVYQSSLIYGGLSGFWDFGPVGALLKRNIEEAWLKRFVYGRDDIYLIDSPVIYNPKVWEASGHVADFNDLMRECEGCHKRFKSENVGKNCPECGGKLSAPRKFNLMFKTETGLYLRPETAAGIFMNFKNILDTFSPKLPFGIAQIGKAFRNEITYGDFIFRTKEFTQMEIEYFVKDVDEEKNFKLWVDDSYKFFQDIGLSHKNLDLYQHKKEDLSHYSKKTTDIRYKFPFGVFEIQGTANRGQFDLTVHTKGSGVELKYEDHTSGKKYFPSIIEPSFGIERTFLAILCDSYVEEKLDSGKLRILLKLKYNLAPFKVGVFPLVANKEDIVKKAKKVYNLVKAKIGSAIFDDNDNIGKRYRRQDEIGTPYCITIDYQSLEDDTITVRDRDTMKQERVSIDKLIDYINVEGNLNED